MPVCPAWALPVDEVLRQHGVQDVSVGLSSGEVEARREQYGFNELRKQPGTPLWKLILEQFDDTLVKVGGNARRSTSDGAPAAACSEPTRARAHSIVCRLGSH